MIVEFIPMVTDLAHMIAVGALGLFAGAMLTEAGVLVPYWRSVDAGTFQTWYRGNAARLVHFFGGLTWCAGLSALAWALLASAVSSVGQTWAVASAGLIVAAVAMFPLFFKQANAGFLAGGRSDDEMARALRRWAMWHWVRTGISLGTHDRSQSGDPVSPGLSRNAEDSLAPSLASRAAGRRGSMMSPVR